MEPKIKKILAEAQEKLTQVKDQKKLNDLYVNLFGKNSALNNLTKEISKLTPTERPKAGQSLNAAKKELEKLFADAKSAVSSQSSVVGAIDVTAPGAKNQIGHLHLVSQAIEEI